MDSQNQSSQTAYHRFQVFMGHKETSKVTRTKTVGMAYLREGQQMYTLRLWMHSMERYYLLPTKNDPSKYLLMVREPNKKPNAKNKFFWNIVGNATSLSSQGVIELNFDLLEKSLYMSFFPEPSAFSNALPDPEEFAQEAA